MFETAKDGEKLTPSKKNWPNNNLHQWLASNITEWENKDARKIGWHNL